MIALVYPYGTPVARGLLKQSALDFEVDEEFDFTPDGAGEHLWIRVEKQGLDTPELIRRVARDAGLEPRRIGYSGLKDRRALTRQWLSLHLPGAAAADRLGDGDGYRVLARARHRRKLRIGSHRGNRFRVRLRAVTDFGESARAQLARIDAEGWANYFGRQRFGRRGDNVAQALDGLARKRLPRRRRGLLISALRSFLFNQILSRRIASGHWEAPLDGDVFMLRGSHSVFDAALDDAIAARFRALDISPAIALYGVDLEARTGPADAIARRVYDDFGDIVAALEQVGARAQWRASRAPAEDLDYRYDANAGVLELEVRLPAGSYLTSLLDHFIVTEDA